MTNKRAFESPRVIVDISAEIIDSGIERDSSHCMIAKAIRTARPNAKHISVDLQTIRFTDPTKRLRYNYLTPRKAQIALVQFDQGIRPDPFSMILSGAHVVAMTARNPKTRHEKPASREAESPPKKKRGKRRLGKAEIVPRGGGGSGVQVIGGRPPRLMPMARRRAFGIKGLQAGWSPPTEPATAIKKDERR